MSYDLALQTKTPFYAPVAESPSSLSFIEKIQDSNVFLNLRSEETLTDGLRRLDPNLVTPLNGNGGFFSRYKVKEGNIGLAWKNGHAHFIPPGNYSNLGKGVSFSKAFDYRNPINTPSFVHGDITYINLTANHLAVVHVDSAEHIIGSGRYLLRHPAQLLDNPINLCKLSDKVLLPNEEETRGESHQAGGILFLRSNPTVDYVIQRADGTYRIGSGFTIVRGQEKFITTIDRGLFSYNEEFVYQTADLFDVGITMNYAIQMENSLLWRNQIDGDQYYDDILSDIIDSLLAKQFRVYKKEDFLYESNTIINRIEKCVRPKLKKSAKTLGLKLTSICIQNLSFPKKAPAT